MPRRALARRTNPAAKGSIDMTDTPDFTRINMLLDIVHNSIDIPGLNVIRSSAMAELTEIENGLAKDWEAKRKAAADEAAAASSTEKRLYGQPVSPSGDDEDPNTYAGGSALSGNAISPAGVTRPTIFPSAKDKTDGK